MEDDTFEDIYAEDEEYRRWLDACNAADDEDDSDDPDGMDLDAQAAPAAPAAPAEPLPPPPPVFSWDAFNPVPLRDTVPPSAYTPQAEARRCHIAEASPLYPYSASYLTGLPKATTSYHAEEDVAVDFAQLLQGLPSERCLLRTLEGEEDMAKGKQRLMQEAPPHQQALRGGADPAAAAGGSGAPRPSAGGFLREMDKLKALGVAVKPGVEIASMTTRSFHAFAKDTLAAASSIIRIQKGLAILGSTCPTPYSLRPAADSPLHGGVNGVAPLIPALSHVVKATLQVCSRFFAVVESKMHAERLVATGGVLPGQQTRLASLLGVSRALQKSHAAVWLQQCESTVRSALELTQDRYGATVLLDRLYRTSERMRNESAPTAPLAYTMFATCLRPYLEEVGRWVTSGRLALSLAHEPMLFISESARCKDPYAEWDSKWSVRREKLPCFLTRDTADTILHTGKSVRFLTSLRSKLILSSIKASAHFKRGYDEMANSAEKVASAADTCHTPPLNFYAAFQERFGRSAPSPSPRPSGDTVMHDATAPEAPSIGFAKFRKVAALPAELAPRRGLQLLSSGGGAAEAGDGPAVAGLLLLNGSIPHLLHVAGSEMAAIHSSLERERRQAEEAALLPPLCVSLRGAVEDVVRCYSRRVGDALVSSLHKHCDMQARLDLLQSVFLLRRGDVMHHFCSKHLFPVARHADWSAKPPSEVMMSHFGGSWLVNKASEADQRNAAQLHCRWEPDDGNVACLRFHPNDPTPRLPVDRPMPPPSLRIVASFALDVFTHGTYSPLNVVFPSEVTQCYTRVLQVLLTVAYAQHLLVAMRLPKMARKPNSLEKRIIALKLHLLHFIQALNDHLLQKTHALWEAGMEKVSQATDIESLRARHKDLAQSLLEAVNFSSRQREHWTTILSIVKLTIRFDDCTKAYRDHMRLESIGGQAMHTGASIAEMQRTLPTTLDTEIMSQFRRHMQFFVATLRSHGGSSAANVMLARFDFNGVYSEQKGRD